MKGLGGMSGSSVKDPGLRGSVERQVCVLVVEDDPALQRMILNYFVENNIRTLVASNGQEMVGHLAGAEVNLVILDLRLGLEDGLDLLRKVRLSSEVPVIIITGHRLDEIDRVVGLELGADDYLTKPFNLRELLARVRAILRRFDVGRAAPPRDPERAWRRICVCCSSRADLGGASLILRSKAPFELQPEVSLANIVVGLQFL